MIRGSGPTSFAPQSAAGRESPPRPRRTLKKKSSHCSKAVSLAEQSSSLLFACVVQHCSKAESLADYSTGQRPVFPSTPHRHGCKPVRALPLPSPRPRIKTEIKLSPLIRGSGPASFASQSAAGRESPPRSRRNLTQRRRDPQRKPPFPPRPFFLLSYFLLSRPIPSLPILSPSLSILLNRIPAPVPPRPPRLRVKFPSLPPPSQKIRSHPFPSV